MTSLMEQPVVRRTSPPALLELEGLVVDYGFGETRARAVDGVDLTIHEGEIVGLAGESGCGKTTIANAVMQILRPPGHIAAGTMSFRGENLIGKSEEELTAANMPYEVGRAFYKEIARGQIVGDLDGLLKLIFHRETKELLGVHIIGEGATELVHIGQAVLTYGGNLDFFVHNVFNYPTLAECYRTAALDGINRLGRA